MAGVKLDTRKLNELQRQIDPRAQMLIKKAAFDIEQGAKDRAPIITGFLKGSISAEIEKFRARIGPAAEYGIYVELGTRKMRARPYLVPAFEQVKPYFLAAWKELFK